MKILGLGEEEIRRALPMREAVEAMKAAFAALSAGRAAAPRRLHVPVEPAGGTLLVKPAFVPGEGLGAKLVSVFPANRAARRPTTTGIVLLLDAATGEPAALLDGTFLTAWRTGAASGAATDLLARRDARGGAIFGCGAQARTQALAIDAVRDLGTIRVYARTREAAEAFVEEMAPRLRARIERAGDPEEALEGAGVVCAATTSATPVFDGRRLRPGAHVNAVGSFTPEMREIDGTAVGRSRVFVDHREAALAEAGDLLAAIREGRTRPEEWTEIGEVAAGTRPGRLGGAEITLFKSVGVAVQDVVAAARAVERARGLGLGTAIEI